MSGFTLQRLCTSDCIRRDCLRYYTDKDLELARRKADSLLVFEDYSKVCSAYKNNDDNVRNNEDDKHYHD